MKRGRIARIEIDTDKDGAVDRWEYYDESNARKSGHVQHARRSRGHVDVSGACVLEDCRDEQVSGVKGEVGEHVANLFQKECRERTRARRWNYGMFARYVTVRPGSILTSKPVRG
jgi:hypothetical protein